MAHRKDNYKIIITVKPDIVHPEKLKNYCTYKGRYEKCYDLYKLYSEKHSSSVFTISEFLCFLQSELKIKDELGRTNTFFKDKSPDWFSYDNVFPDENFKKWIKQKRNKGKLIKKLVATEADFLIRKREGQEIYILPVLNNGFDKQNIKYIERIIGALKEKDGGDMYLLLHDKDLYDDNQKHHPVSNGDRLGVKLEDNSILKALINDNKVFVFQHTINEDKFYSDIILELGDLSTDEIIKKLEEQAQVVLFGKKISKCMMRSEMEKAIDAEGSNKYDFSKPFLD